MTIIQTDTGISEGRLEKNKTAYYDYNFITFTTANKITVIKIRKNDRNQLKSNHLDMNNEPV